MTSEKREIPECLLNAADPQKALEMACVKDEEHLIRGQKNPPLYQDEQGDWFNAWFCKACEAKGNHCGKGEKVGKCASCAHHGHFCNAGAFIPPRKDAEALQLRMVASQQWGDVFVPIAIPQSMRAKDVITSKALKSGRPAAATATTTAAAKGPPVPINPHSDASAAVQWKVLHMVGHSPHPPPYLADASEDFAKRVVAFDDFVTEKAALIKQVADLYRGHLSSKAEKTPEEPAANRRSSPMAESSDSEEERRPVRFWGS
ncbi:unnamed protein product [Jaminaea pallidilutea]